MKKRIMALGMMSFIIVPFCCPSMGREDSYNNTVMIQHNHEQKEVEIIVIEELTSITEIINTAQGNSLVTLEDPEIKNIDEIEVQSKLINKDYVCSYNKMLQEINEISIDFGRKKYIEDYKSIINNYPKEFHKETIYDVFSEEELELLFRVVQAEVGDYDFDSKTNVASVIFNRYYDKDTTMTEVLTAKNQFSTISNGRYMRVIVDEETILACEYVFLFGDTTNGATYFDSTNGKSWAARETRENRMEHIFKDEAGHDFYKEKGEE